MIGPDGFSGSLIMECTENVVPLVRGLCDCRKVEETLKFLVSESPVSDFPPPTYFGPFVFVFVASGGALAGRKKPFSLMPHMRPMEFSVSGAIQLKC